MEIDNGMKEYLRGLQASLQSQETVIDGLRNKNKRLEAKLQNCESFNEELKTKVEELSKQVSDLKDQLKRQENPIQPVSTEEITLAAEDAVHDQFLKSLAYEETSGLYYCYKSGLYYDASRRCYYDGQAGIYVKYHEETGQYVPMKGCDKFDSTNSSDTEDESERQTVAQIANDSGNVESKEMSDGEVSSPSPPPTIKKRQKSEKELRKEERKRRKKIRKEMSIPCIRMVVHSSPEEIVKPGTLFIITCAGGSVGREGSHDVLLTGDPSVSKLHAKISYDDKEAKYFLVDVGSSNGTFIDGKRLTESKQESNKKTEIGHGTLIKFGSTQVICHVHPGAETCLKCEPGVVISSGPKVTKASDKESREKSRKNEVKQMRKKYGIGQSSNESDGPKASGYNDRAEDRRKTVGSDCPFEKTQSASTTEKLEKSNKGFKMLSKMGWKDGDGLGKDKKGRVNPVQVKEKNDRVGLGSSITLPTFDQSQQRRFEVLKKTQERFSQL